MLLHHCKGAAGVQGMKVGVMRQIINQATADLQFTTLFNQALKDLQAAGARSCFAVHMSAAHLWHGHHGVCALFPSQLL